MPRLSRLLAAAATGLVLGGCGSVLSLLPPGIPTGSQLESYANTDFAPAYKIGATPRDTLVIGVAYVDQRCSEFFDAVEQMARRTEVFASGFSTAATQTLALMALAEHSALPDRSGGCGRRSHQGPAQRVQEAVRFCSTCSGASLVQAMAAQRTELGVLLERNAQPYRVDVISEVDVIAAVKRYAENCTLGTIREHWNNALAKAVREGVQPDIPARPPPGALLSRAPSFKATTTPRPANILGVNRYVVR